MGHPNFWWGEDLPNPTSANPFDSAAIRPRSGRALDGFGALGRSPRCVLRMTTENKSRCNDPTPAKPAGMGHPELRGQGLKTN
jgi:hypothetical protein